MRERRFVWACGRCQDEIATLVSRFGDHVLSGNIPAARVQAVCSALGNADRLGAVRTVSVTVLALIAPLSCFIVVCPVLTALSLVV